jgi:hypothetical protein
VLIVPNLLGHALLLSGLVKDYALLARPVRTAYEQQLIVIHKLAKRRAACMPPSEDHLGNDGIGASSLPAPNLLGTLSWRGLVLAGIHSGDYYYGVSYKRGHAHIRTRTHMEGADASAGAAAAVPGAVPMVGVQHGQGRGQLSGAGTAKRHRRRVGTACECSRRDGHHGMKGVAHMLTAAARRYVSLWA